MPALMTAQTTNADSTLGWVYLKPGLYILDQVIQTDGSITLQTRRVGETVPNPVTQNGSALTLTKTSGTREFNCPGWEVLATLAGRTAGSVSLDARPIGSRL